MVNLFYTFRMTILLPALGAFVSYKKHDSYNKQNGSLATLTVLLIFSLDLGISGVVIQGIHQNSEK